MKLQLKSMMYLFCNKYFILCGSILYTTGWAI